MEKTKLPNLALKNIEEALHKAYQKLEPFSNSHRHERNSYKATLILISKYIKNGQEKVLDVGTGIGIIPLTLKFLNIESYGLDKYIFGDLISPMFKIDKINELKKIWQDNDLKIYERDIIKDSRDLEYVSHQIGPFDIIISSATIEHVKTPRLFLQNIRNILKQNGLCIVLTPNLASISKRIRFLFGLSPYCELKKFFDLGGTKFIGHWREYTIKELKQMFAWSGFKVIETLNINTLPIRPLRNVRDFYYLILRLISFFIPNSSQANIIISQKL